MHGLVHAADVHDSEGGTWLMATLFGLYPFLRKLFADSAYRGAKFQAAATRAVAKLEVEIVTRGDAGKGFIVLPKRWIVERSIAWLNRCRRLAKDWECRNRNGLAFLRLASIRLMLRKLCNPV
jgi:transposase